MNCLIALAVVAGLTWGTLYVLRGSIITGCLVFLLVNSCLGFYFFNFDVGPLNMTLDRPVLALVGLAYLVQRWLKRTDPKPLGRDDLVALALIAWLGIRVIGPDWLRPAPEQPSPLWLWLSGYVSPLVLYWIVRQSPLNEGAIRKIQLFFIVLGVYLSITGVFEITHQWWLVFPKHIADPNLAQHFGRARGAMVNAMALGFFLTICLLCTWNYRDRLGLRGQTLLLAICGLNLVALYLTYTRVVWIGAVASMLIVAWFTLPRRVSLVGIVGVLVASGLLVLAKGDELWSLDTGRVASQTRDSSEMRLSFNYVAWQMFLDRPVLGWGLGQFVHYSPLYLSDRSTEFLLERIRGAPVHNEFMSILTETGPIGLGLLVTMLGVWAYTGWTLWRGVDSPTWVRTHGLMLMAVIGAYVCHGFFHPLGHTYMVQFALYLVAGVGVGLRQKMTATHQVPSPLLREVAPAQRPAAAWLWSPDNAC